MKKKVIAFTIADKNNMKYADMMIKSLRKFHSEEELPLIVIGEEQLAQYKADPNFFYRATPIIASKLIPEYDMVLKLDCDQLVLGSLDQLLAFDDYDVGTVLNINRVDPKRYGLVQVQGVAANEYFNCGLVAMRSEIFVSHWLNLCQSKYFERFQYREQDILNILAHFGNYNTRCFDNYDNVNQYYAWHGLVAKGEGLNMVVRGDKIIVPRGKDNYPDRDVEVKLYHWAGGGNEAKMNYRIDFGEDVINRINELLK